MLSQRHQVVLPVVRDTPQLLPLPTYPALQEQRAVQQHGFFRCKQLNTSDTEADVGVLSSNGGSAAAQASLGTL